VNATTPADRARWQRRCAHTLATILDTHQHLPVLVWTVTAAGISARVLVVDAMHSALDQFTAWTTALHLHPRRYDTPSLDRSYLHARGEFDRTRITITAVIDHTR
jgi:hypothetical protein